MQQIFIRCFIYLYISHNQNLLLIVSIFTTIYGVKYSFILYYITCNIDFLYNSENYYIEIKDLHHLWS